MGREEMEQEGATLRVEMDDTDKRSIPGALSGIPIGNSPSVNLPLWDASKRDFHL